MLAQGHRGWADRELLCTEEVLGRRGQEEGRSQAPNDPTRTGGFRRKNALCRMSPKPACELSGTTSSCSVTGTIVREIRFQSSEIEIGMTG